MKFKSQVLTEASGSVGGLTYSHNRGGMYTRARSVPTNPNSSYQQIIRGFVAALTSAWQDTLTAAQRTAWDTYALNVLMKDRLGENRNIGGLAHYCRSNVPRLQAGLTRVDDGPTTFNLGEFTNPTIDEVDATADEIDVGFTEADDWVGEDGAAMMVLVSRPVGVAINYFKGPYRFAGSIDGDAVTPLTTPQSLALPFPVVVDQKVFASFRVSRADGRLSLPFCLAGTAV